VSSQIDDLRLFAHALGICMLEAELVSVAMDESSRVVSHRKPFTERGLPTWLTVFQRYVCPSG
jgi:hypothetical protein